MQKTKEIAQGLVGLLAFMAGVGAAVPAAAQGDVPALKMRATNSYPESQPVGQAMDLFAKRVAELSGGKMQVQVFHSGKLYTEEKSIQAVLDGTVDIGMASAGNHAPFTKAYQALETPYLLNKEQFRQLVIRGSIGQEMKQSAAKDGLHALMFVETGGHRILGSSRPIGMPEDAKGLKIRVAQSPVILAFYRAAGANPTVVPWGETYLALASKTVEGVDVSLAAYPIVKLWEVARYISTLYWSPAATVVDVSVKWWDQRTPRQREILEQAAREAEEFSMKAEDRNDVALRALLKSNGAIIHDLTPDERAAWEKVGRSVWNSLPTNINELERIDKAAQAIH